MTKTREREGEAEREGERGREKDGRVYELIGGFGGAVALQHLKASNLCLH